MNLVEQSLMSSSLTVHGTGLIALDIVTESLPEGTTYQWAGGTCGNVLTILSYLGWNSFPISRMDDSPHSEKAIQDMKSWGVNDLYLSLQPTASIPVIFEEIIPGKDSQPARHKFHWRNCPNCNAWLPNFKAITLKASKFLKEDDTSCDVFFFDRVSPAAIDLAEFYKNKGSIIFFEPSAKGTANHLQRALELADIVKYSNQRFDCEALQSDKRPFLEIQTLGSEGLQYRVDSQGEWCSIPSFEVKKVLDSCGCGDWATAGIISKLCTGTREDLYSNDIDSIKNALSYGQALGSWNCGFEGARSGMYSMTKETFENEICSILETKSYEGSSRKPNIERSDTLNKCPLCPN